MCRHGSPQRYPWHNSMTTVLLLSPTVLSSHVGLRLSALPAAPVCLPSAWPSTSLPLAAYPLAQPPPPLVLCSGKLPTLPRVSFPWLLRVQTAVPPSGPKWERSLQKPSGNGRIGSHSLNKPWRAPGAQGGNQCSSQTPERCLLSWNLQEAGRFLPSFSWGFPAPLLLGALMLKVLGFSNSPGIPSCYAALK